MTKLPAEQGQSAEVWLAEQLTQQGWQVLARRWHCRWGELDLVLLGEELVVFVEVKARRQVGIDGQGLLAITPAKQRKLIRTAGLFLASREELEQCACRFDVALVGIQEAGFYLHTYISGAFEVAY
ncbi:YraN family protein [Anthocerotibacter panamensis]|uniref:YraN family protein n=1 Tax=Anthocerotibacter panamensis TaxID=2857077 RepID=UPI001C404F11|nr:YraN family protein [Anthocerotibacter panamensis]